MEFEVPTPAPANAPLNPVPEEAAIDNEPANASASISAVESELIRIGPVDVNRDLST